MYAEHIAALESGLEREKSGLPEPVFRFISRHTPLVCVDLLIQDRHGRSLLTWRDDEYFGSGWHLPGGVVRFKESRAERILAVGRAELGAEVSFEPVPLAIQEFVNVERDERGHHVCFLHRCVLQTAPIAELAYEAGSPRSGQWGWHVGAPADLLAVHRVYEKFLSGTEPLAPTGQCFQLPFHETR